MQSAGDAYEDLASVYDTTFEGLTNFCNPTRLATVLTARIDLEMRFMRKASSISSIAKDLEKAGRVYKQAASIHASSDDAHISTFGILVLNWRPLRFWQPEAPRESCDLDNLKPLPAHAHLRVALFISVMQIRLQR